MQLAVKNNCEFMLSYLPHYLARNKRVQALFKAVSLIFDDIDNKLNKLNRMWLIDEATGEFLDDLGELVGEKRNNSDDERYRKRIKLAFKLTNFVPHLNSLLEICKFYTGLNPEIRLGWEEDGEPGRYDVDFVANRDYNFSLIDDFDLDRIAGGGIKVNTRKCIDNYKTVRYAKGFKSGGRGLRHGIRRAPICDFIYTASKYSGSFNSAGNNLNKMIKMSGGKK